MSVNNAICRMMAELGSDDFGELLKSPHRLKQYLQQVYLPDSEPMFSTNIAEAMELAQTEEETINSAAYVWWKLQQRQREQLLEVLRSMGGDSKDLQEELDLHLPN